MKEHHRAIRGSTAASMDSIYDAAMLADASIELDAPTDASSLSVHLLGWALRVALTQVVAP